MSLCLSICCLEHASSFTLRVLTCMFLLVCLGESCLCQSLCTLILAVRKLQVEIGMGHIQSSKSKGIPGSAHWETS